MKLKVIAIVGIISLCSLVLTTGVSAMTVADYNTKANVIFKENEEITLPVDPNDPEKEVTPEVEGEDIIDPGTPGPLSIDYASHINFGEVEISGNARTYFANPITFEEGGESAPYVQVTDNRGTRAGWELQVKQEEEFKKGESTLAGAELSLINGEVNSASATSGVTATDIVFDNHNELYPVLTAVNESGAGTFTNQFGEIVDGKATDVSLYIPAGLVIEEGKYSTTLNWVLVDTP